MNHSVLLKGSYSLFAHWSSYKVGGLQLQFVSCRRKPSIQSDSALLPSNVLFQQTLSPVSPAPRTISKTSRRRGKKVCFILLLTIVCICFFKKISVFQEEDVSRTLDQAIEVARSMKKTTDRMARRLSADLAKAQLHRKLYNMQPLEGRKHQTF